MVCSDDLRIYHDNRVGDDVFYDECEREYKICSLHPVIRKNWRQIMTTVLKKTNISGYCSFGKTHPEHNY